ncbi:transketolase family protein [Candidatus Magnetominusculus xianensis]|uniref:1-deoxy-D-xylulose-5-phosphate synthase n=1 Tax=Candidatus Magnetominusculus xianensis TaxID=1748249 RepID=A0ABR5SIM0_9BACT|nr:transketolase C-terminal domain-containing protein [Candidatus Magnetominusculus xianensis]KWT92778.1 1-deoxy-D-xylulose-5-phosphate synthase [Candidatus Magnetominusculus xianensis]MBF0405232.1 1-deoxy-D-xylulose-5-phosphate synthase [Nitrospirota bacterium]
MNNIAQRDAFWNRIYDIAAQDRNVILISADMGAPSLDKYRKDLPAQFVNVGIAEQNAVLIGSGLALKGKKVYLYAIAPFITLRCLEQIRVECSIMNIPMTIVGVGAGMSYQDSGPTHHVLEDITIMRSMPNITIHNITDSVMASAVAGMNIKNTTYVRIDREVFPDIYSPDTDFRTGAAVVKEGKDCYLLSTGCMTHAALHAAKRLEGKSIDVGVIDIYTFPINEEFLLETLKGVRKVVSIEEHFLPGALGSAVGELILDNGLPIKLRRLGITHAKGFCYKYGGRETIREYYGLDRESLDREIERFLTD